MKLEYLLEFWKTMTHASTGNVVVAHDIAEATLEALARLDNIQDAIVDLHDITEQTLG